MKPLIRIVIVAGLFLGEQTTVFAQWTQTNGPGGGVSISSIAVLGHNLFAGSDQGLFISTDNGTSWSHVANATLDSGNVMFVNRVGNLLFTSVSGLTNYLFSADSGRNWNYESGLPGGLSVVGQGTRLFTPTSEAIFASSDSGKSWDPFSAFFYNNQMSILSLTINDSTFFVGTAGNGVFTSTDNGAVWSASATGSKITSVVSLTTIGSEVFASSRFYGIYLSTDNGSTWTANNSGLTNSSVTSLLTVGTDVFAVCYGNPTLGDVFVSTDSGRTWKNVSDGLDSVNVSCLTSNGNDLYVGTFGQGVWSRPLSEVVTGVHGSKAAKPQKFSLSQNYPNPFNPTTEIDYSVPKNSFVTLKVYNVLGKEVATLFSGMRIPGQYQATFNASRFASGVYFYRLQAGSYSMTKKMLLLK